jgi:cell wall-associated NlpC family hydrolase
MRKAKKILSLLIVTLVVMGSLSIGNAVAVDGNTIVADAENWIGTPYLMGGNSSSGIDCSHFVQTVYNEVGMYYTYKSATSWSESPSSPPSQLKKVTTPQKGDIVIFKSGAGTSYGHAGIYISSSQFIGAQDDGVGYASFGTYWGGKRKIAGYYRFK